MKKHFEILDGLRGTAALLVVMFHLLEVTFWNPAENPLHHAYLAVDFFFLLSGFVIGYAYDDRWKSMTIKDFFKIRLIRLHPLVVAGVIFGAIGYWFDPFVGDGQHVTLLRILLGVGMGLLLIPSPTLPNRWTETHSLNGPSWSLSQEYLVNLIYGLIGPRLSRRVLSIIVVISGILLAFTSITHGHLQGGWGWDTIWMAPIRVTFPFFAGLLIYRLKAKIRIPITYPILSFLLLIIFMLPYFPNNGIYEAVCVLIFFPLIIVAGVGGTVTGRTATLCNFLGKISYPLYILHYPFIYIYTHWYYDKHPSAQLAIIVGCVLVPFFVVLSWFFVRYYDLPVRAILSLRLNRKVK